MGETIVQFATGSDGSIRVTASGNGGPWEHQAPAAGVTGACHLAERLAGAFEDGRAKLADPVLLAECGRLLADTFLAPLYAKDALAGGGTLLLASGLSEVLNLPWELLPSRDGKFLVEDGQWAIRRRVRPLDSPAGVRPAVAGPLRVLFMACAPSGAVPLDYEKEEDAILRVRDRLGGGMFLDILDSGTFDELRAAIAELRPHVVHLSGHGKLVDGVGHFYFENEDGDEDARGASVIAGQLLGGHDVRAVFFSGCQTARAGLAGLCQTVTRDAHVPLALGWGASIADGQATEFAAEFYHRLGVGEPIDAAVGGAQQKLLADARRRSGGLSALDASFALPQLYAADSTNRIVDPALARVPPSRPQVEPQMLGDNIRGLREGFVGRRRILQRTRPPLSRGDYHVLLLTGIGGAGKSTLATRIANRFQQDGYHVVPVQARREEADRFCLHLLSELATGCNRIGREGDEGLLLDGRCPVAQRLRLAVEVLKENRLLLVLDNLEAMMPPPPAAPRWVDDDFAGFVRGLVFHLTGQGRAILTCRYLPEGLDTANANVRHEPMPDFTGAEFFKYLGRDEKVAARMERTDERRLPRDLLAEFHRKLGATPRFIEQATAVLRTIDPDDLRDQLDGVAEGEIQERQQEYFRDLFLPQLYDALPPKQRRALSRLAVVEVPLPADGVEKVSGLDAAQTPDAIARWLGLSLVQRFAHADETPLYAVYPLQRDFLMASGRLSGRQSRQADQAAAEFFQASFEAEREAELRLPIEVELAACLHHATLAGDRDRCRWAAVRLGRGLHRRAEYRSALALIEPLMEGEPHADLLKTSADMLIRLGEWKEARSRLEKALPLFVANGDRSQEGGTWHQLASIDLEEGNYPAAREKFGKSLAIKQAIGDRAGEAAT